MKYQSLKFPAAILFLIFIVFYVSQNLNHRFWMHDFEVYYSASGRLLSGEQIYNIPFGLSSGNYKYCPFFLILMVPFALLPFFMARTVYFFLGAAIFIYILFYLYKIFFEHFFHLSSEKFLKKTILISSLIVSTHIYRELHLGNINLILLLVLILGFKSLVLKNDTYSGILLGVSIIIKPHFLVFLPYLLVKKRIKVALITLITIIVCILLPAVFIGLHYNNQLLSEWVSSMLGHNTTFIKSDQTIYAIFNRVFLFSHDASAVPSVITFGSIAIVFALFLIFIIYNNHTRKNENISGNENHHKMISLFELFIILASIPLITETDTEHFLFSLPIIMFILLNLLIYPVMKKHMLLPCILAFVLFGGNIYEILGRNFSNFLTKFGALGIANMLLIILSLKMFYQIKEQTE